MSERKKLFFLLDDLNEEENLYLYEEVGATPESVSQDVVQLREWLEKQPHLPNLTANEDEWLARYLLACKNSLERAKHRLSHFFTVQARWPDFFSPPSVEAGLAFAQYMQGAPLPVHTPEGSRVCVYQFTKAVADEPEKMDWKMFYMLSLGYLEAQICAEYQPLHVEIIVDVEYYSIGLNNSFMANLTLFKRFLYCLQSALPLHVRRIHVLNAPSLAIIALDKLIRPFLPEKLSQRIVTHDSVESLAKAIPPECLTKDLGGTIDATVKEWTLHWAEMAQAGEEWFKNRRWMKADLALKPDCKSNTDFGIEGSFRKLAVD